MDKIYVSVQCSRKRNENGITEPFDNSDDFDFVIITARNDNNFGQFIFPKSVLATKGILTKNGKKGKRGIRVYPPWDETTSKQAQKTQKWQLDYFFRFSDQDKIDLNEIRKIF